MFCCFIALYISRVQLIMTVLIQIILYSISYLEIAMDLEVSQMAL